ncbi:MAG: hypothetical protein A2Y64_09480 [Candidatus Coatesbacteria bacterium RBG_13_66_14]|uniref:Uncharacterized protein n=1 Tax=Candidatus Coatesbacteria bacterium RBG_13_66_14 TaxID=1817816 RepID=A0A1F5FFS5_9BACT|nr:MAG: hypothetical protein A2Y64_09480 [Candidatus Coatesbacteria bacterium RBG_13_66_14]
MRFIWTIVSLGVALTAILVILCNVNNWSEQAAEEADRATAEAYGIDPDTLDLPGAVTVTGLEIVGEGPAPEIRLRVQNTGGRNLYNVHVRAELLDAGGKELWNETKFDLEPVKIPTGDPAKGSVVVTDERFASVGTIRAEDVVGVVEVRLPE